MGNIPGHCRPRALRRDISHLKSWIEHLRQHQRVTHADRLLQQNLRPFLRGAPHVTHFVATEARHER